MTRKPSPTLRASNQIDGLSPTDRALMTRCRCIGIVYAQNHGTVTAAHVGRIEPAFHDIHRKKQGQIFRMKKIFERTDATTINTFGKSKGHLIRVWRIRDNVAASEYVREANLELPNINLI